MTIKKILVETEEGVKDITDLKKEDYEYFIFIMRELNKVYSEITTTTLQ